jgi:hypothetical protein
MGKRSRKAKSQRSDRLFAEFEQAVTKATRASKKPSAGSPQTNRESIRGPATRDL